MQIKNPNEENDFVSGHTICAGDAFRWIQRLTDSYGLILTLSGTGRVSLGTASRQLEAGDLLLLKPHWQHQFDPDDNWDLLWFHFLPRPHIIHALEWPDVIPGTGCVRLDEAEFQAVRTALTEANNLEYHRPNGWNALAFLLLESAVVRGYNRSVRESSGAEGWIGLAQRLLTDTANDMDRIASRCNVSRAALYVKFKKATGVSPRQYREYAILRRAARLLENMDLSVAEIARQVGMPDPYYFSTRFRKFSGFPPREYRREMTQRNRPAENAPNQE